MRENPASPLSGLDEAGIVEQVENSDYRLSREGNELLTALAPRQDWAGRRADRRR